MGRRVTGRSHNCIEGFQSVVFGLIRKPRKALSRAGEVFCVILSSAVRADGLFRHFNRLQCRVSRYGDDQVRGVHLTLKFKVDFEKLPKLGPSLKSGAPPKSTERARDWSRSSASLWELLPRVREISGPRPRTSGAQSFSYHRNLRIIFRHRKRPFWPISFQRGVNS